MAPSVAASLLLNADHAEFAGEYDDSIDPISGSPLRQGDVIQILSDVPNDGGLGEHFGIVVTANCDLMWNKHFGVVTYVPVVPVEVYVHRYLLPKLLFGELEKAQKALRLKVLEKGNRILFDRVLDMIETRAYSPAEISRLLPAGINVGSDVARQMKIKEAIDKFNKADTPAEAFAVVAVLAGDVDAILKVKKPSVLAFFADLRNRLTGSLAGDALFIGRISRENCSGYVAVLRLLKEIAHGQISLSAVGEHRDPHKYSARRIACLRTLYTHRLVQQMSHVFTDIGLPEDYETARCSVVENRLRGLLGISDES
jgi:hypothetical protein